MSKIIKLDDVGEEIGNKVYAVVWYPKSGEPQVLREFRSYKKALLHKLDMMDKCDDFNLVIKVRDAVSYRDTDEEDYQI